MWPGAKYSRGYIIRKRRLSQALTISVRGSITMAWLVTFLLREAVEFLLGRALVGPLRRVTA